MNRFVWLEAPFILAIALIGCLLLPFCALWWAFTTPKTWRKPKDVGKGFYEHP